MRRERQGKKHIIAFTYAMKFMENAHSTMYEVAMMTQAKSGGNDAVVQRISIDILKNYRKGFFFSFTFSFVFNESILKLI